MADLHIAKECERDHDYGKQDVENVKPVNKVTDEKLEGIIERLYRTHTMSSSGVGCEEPMTARDTISKSNVNREQVDDIIERLYKTHTKAMQVSYLKTFLVVRVFASYKPTNAKRATVSHLNDGETCLQ